MAKYDVTPELAETIKSVRIQNHVTAKSVAEHIGKSQSYMSKLEKGDIKSIQEEELTRILRFIFGSDESFQDFLNSTLDKLLDTLELRYSNKEIDEQLWFYNYDTVLRYIPIPDSMVDDINSRMFSLQISSSEICDRINSNEDISPEVKNTDQYPFNEWQAFVVDHQVRFHFIKMMVSNTEIEQILTRECTRCNYVTLLSLVYYLLKIEKKVSVPEDDSLMREAHDYLNSYKFYSLAEKYKLSQQAKTDAELDNLMSTFDKTNSALMNEVITAFSVFSDLDIAKMNKYLEAFVNNLKWDNSFMMTLLGTSFFDLESISYTAKKQMLTEIQAITEKYKELPDVQRQLELYE